MHILTDYEAYLLQEKCRKTHNVRVHARIRPTLIFLIHKNKPFQIIYVLRFNIDKPL